MIQFSLAMAWRETRAAWRHFLYFFVCIALGVGALVGVALFGVQVEGAVTREARGLMGGDMEVRLSRQMSQAGEAAIRSLAERGVDAVHVSELVAMAAAAGRPAQPAGPAAAARPTQIVELKAVEPGYPFYGNLKVEPDRPLMDLLLPPREACPQPAVPPATAPPQPPPAAGKKRKKTPVAEEAPRQEPLCLGAVVQEALLIRMDLKPGDRLKIGEAVVTITGVLRKEPDRVAGAFSLGPRVMIAREGLAAAALIKQGSRVRERWILRLPPGMPAEPLLHELRGRLAPESARVLPYKDAQPQLKGFLEQLTRYLGLVGLTALFVGGIGVASTVRAFLREKLATIAILKTLGADSATVLRTYLLQTLLLGVIGSLAGAAIGIGLQRGLPPLLASLFPLDAVELSGGLSAASLPPILKGIALGVMTTLLFTLWPLLGIREIRPAMIFRRDVTPAEPVPAGTSPRDLLHAIVRDPSGWQTALRSAARSLDKRRWLTALGLAAGLAVLAVWQAGSVKIGALFIGALLAAVVLLHLTARLLIRVLRALPRLAGASLALRYAIGNLHRPGSQASGILVSIGIGVMVIVAASLLERSLVEDLGASRPMDAPTFFFIDIQPDQRDGFLALLRRQVPDAAAAITPLVRSRLYALKGERVETDEAGEMKDKPPDRGSDGGNQSRRSQKGWYFTREYVLTFLPDLPKDNTIVKGRWWSPDDPPGAALVSIEEEAARNLGVDLGDTMQFDIQGATVTAEVRSIRRVNWGNFSTNFYMIFSPGSLDGAPLTYVATLRVPPALEVPLQQAAVAAFPNVTAIDIGDVLDSLSRVVERVSLAIRAVALFCILTGGIVMAAALATTRYRRLYESVLLKALGATRGLVARSFAAEYAMLGAVAGSIGVGLAAALSWAVLYFILDMPWRFYPGVLALGLFITLLLTLVVGFLSTFRILGQRPLTILRHE